MDRIRVVAADHSALARKVLKEALSAASDIELIGVVGTLGLALSKCADVTPQVIVLDLLMPEEGWQRAMAKLRKAQPHARIVAISPDTTEGRQALLEAVSCGASESVRRPASDVELVNVKDAFGERLLAKVRSAAAAPDVCSLALSRTAMRPRPALPTVPRASAPSGPIEIVAIGVSTGGPNALATVLAGLPGDLPVPVVLVQHMPPVFTANLAAHLDSLCELEVREAADGMDVRAGTVLIAPGDWHMALKRGPTGGVVATTHQGPPENFCRPAVDVLFRSVAELYRGGTLAVVLTGMGQDGLLGAQVIGSAGGTIVAQDEATSVVWGMPGMVARAGVADEVLPLPAIAPYIVRKVQLSRTGFARRKP